MADFGNRVSKDGGFWARTAGRGRIVCVDCTLKIDVLKDLRRKKADFGGFVYVNVFCVAIVLVIVEVLYVCD